MTSPDATPRMLDRMRLCLTGLIVLLGIALFHVRGNTYVGVNPRTATRSCFVWLLQRWGDSGAPLTGADFSYGWLIPLVSLWLLWRRRKALRAAPRTTGRGGLWIVAAGLALHWVGARAQVPHISVFALIFLCWGIPSYLLGWSVGRLLLFPCAYLVFAIPLDFFEQLTVPLRLFTASLTALLLNGLGVHAERVGTAIFSAAGGRFDFDVADPCSGIRSLLAMMALAAAYAYVTQPSLTRRGLLFLLSVPATMLANVGRVVTVALVAQLFGRNLALGFYHKYSGYLIFAFTVLLLMTVGALLPRLSLASWQALLAQWRSRPPPRSPVPP